MYTNDIIRKRKAVLYMRSMAQKMKRTLIVAFIVLMLSGSAMASFDATVLSSKMKVFFAPTTSSKNIGSLKRGTVVTVEAHQGGWARINYKGNVGFARIQDMYSNIVYKNAKAKVDTTIYYITRNNFNPRWGALGKGTKMYIRGQKDNYWLVSNKEFTVLGYVPMANVTILN